MDINYVQFILQECDNLIISISCFWHFFLLQKDLYEEERRILSSYQDKLTSGTWTNHWVNGCSSLLQINWLCKICNFTSSKRLYLLKHYRLQHGHFSRSQSIPCFHSNCPCTFRTWGALRTHLSRFHPQTSNPGQLLSVTCIVCKSSHFHTERQYFEHLSLGQRSCKLA